jgi:hypothetical protein
MPTNPLRPMCNKLRIGPKVGTQDLPLSGLQWSELYSRSEGRANVLLVAYSKSKPQFSFLE